MLTKEQLRPFFSDIYAKSNKVVETLLICYFLFGIALSFFYDTYGVALGVGVLSLSLYFVSKKLFPNRTLNQYMASLVAGIFMAQFIYQMHGLFEMHFTAFIAIIALITYQNKYAFIPQLLFVVIHHSSFAYIQYLGYTNEIDSYQQIYFTQLEYMDFQTFLFHAGLYAVGVTLAAIYTHNLGKNTIKSAENIIKLKAEEEKMKLNMVFAQEIANGNFEFDYNQMEDDQMGEALLNMRENLRKSATREQQEKFINVGLAEVGDIMRNHNEDIEELSYQLISYLAKYMKLNQGGVFILEEDNNESYLELRAAYAYERKKFLEKRIEIGEGLVGQCYLEKEIIYLKEVPKEYVRITSGLGDAPPSNLVIVPIKTEDKVEGVLELASFKELGKFELEFLEKIAENVATTISSAKTNVKTKLLYEQSQQQTEEMRAQEEEMRQNMEELSATQEEIERKSKEFENRFRAVDESGVASIEFDLDANIINANDSFCEAMGYQKNEIVGQHHRIFVDPEYAQSDAYADFWQKLKTGEMQNGEFKRFKKDGSPIFIFGSYSLLRDLNDKPIGFFKMAIDITPYKS